MTTIGESYREDAFILENSAEITKKLEKELKERLEKTPVGSNLASLESAVLLRSISALFGATILPTTLSLKEYNILKKKVVNCIKSFETDVRDGTL